MWQSRLFSARVRLYLACRYIEQRSSLIPRCRVYSPTRSGYGREVDVWSLGVIVFIMLGGRFPFTGATPQEVAEEGLQGRIRFTSTEPWTNISMEGWLSSLIHQLGCMLILAQISFSHRLDQEMPRSKSRDSVDCRGCIEGARKFAPHGLFV